LICTASIMRPAHFLLGPTARWGEATAMLGPALKGAAHLLLPRGFAAMLDFLDGALAGADTS
jgi:hypothetical protein